MDYSIQHKKNEAKDKRRSAVLTLLLALVVFLGLFFYKFTKTIEKPSQVTTMLINFGDNKEGMKVEEPATQEGSLSSAQEIAPTVEPESPTTPMAEKIITGSNPKSSVPKAEKAALKPKTAPKEVTTKPTPAKKAAAQAVKPNAATGNGDGKGTAAIGNLLKGRGTKTGTQGNSTTPGNAGDPLGGEGNGDSKIGIDRKLVGFIPGTMGRGGAQPAHNCSASGNITIAYTVDKAGNVISARRAGGISDPCVVSNSVSWVKQYVKAERASSSSTGTYSIIF